MVAVNDVLFQRAGAAPPRRRADLHPPKNAASPKPASGCRSMPNAIQSAGEMAKLFATFPERSPAPSPSQRHAGFRSASSNRISRRTGTTGKTAQQHLADLAWPARNALSQAEIPERHSGKDHEPVAQRTALIEELDYARYFLTVHDVVAHCSPHAEDPVQGRGSAANQRVCFCLASPRSIRGYQSLVSRFYLETAANHRTSTSISSMGGARKLSSTSIERYGRHRAAICATVIHYRSRRAVGEVGKALG